LTARYRVPEGTDELLRRFISNEENGVFKKGMIMEYVNRAILHYISCEKGHSTRAQHFIKENETMLLKERVSKWLMGEPYKYTGLQNVSEKHLKEAVRVVEGVRDRRAVKDRIDSLLVCGVKKVVNDKSYYKTNQYDFQPEIWQEEMK
jgi:hypothetical protein